MPGRMATATADVSFSGSLILPLNFEEAVELVEDRWVQKSVSEDLTDLNEGSLIDERRCHGKRPSA